MSHQKSNFELDALSDRQPVYSLVADGSRDSAELYDVQNQASGRMQHGLKPVEKIRVGSVKEAVAVVNSTCDECMNQRA